MRQKIFRVAWGLSLLVTASLACNFLTGMGERASDLQETAQFVATGAQDARDIAATGGAIATQVLGNEAVQTAQAVITEQGPGLLATAQAFATEEGPAVAATAQSFQQTAQAFVTQESPGVQATAQAFATQFAGSLDEAPADIPVMNKDETDAFIGTENLVSYTLAEELQNVLQFYETQMPANGWSLVEEETSPATLEFEKPDRTASITLTSILNRTFVVIVIQSK